MTDVWIGSDLDNTISSSYDLIKECWGTALGKDIQLGDIPSASDMLAILEQEEKKKFFKVFNSKFHQCKFLLDAIESLRFMRLKGYKIVIITSRSSKISKSTKQYLDYNQVPYDKLYCEDGIDKAAIIRELNCKFMIEDDIQLASKIAKYTQTYLINYPWNSSSFHKRFYMRDNIIRVSGWNEIMEHEYGNEWKTRRP